MRIDEKLTQIVTTYKYGKIAFHFIAHWLTMRTYHVLLFISYDKLKKYSKRNIKDYDKLWKYYKETFSLDSSYLLWKL